MTSIGLFCNKGCLAIFDEIEVRMIYRNKRKIIIRGGRYPLTNTFMFDINENEMTKKR